MLVKNNYSGSSEDGVRASEENAAAGSFKNQISNIEYRSQATERGEFNRLKEQLETFKAGTLNMEDHFAKLMKSLQHNRNKVQLLDKRQTWVE